MGLRACLLILLFVLPAAARPAAPLRPAPAAPAPMLASPWPVSPPPAAAMLVSEKLDGVRARWDGQQLWSRGGLRIAAPAWFTAGWPGQPLDGELWLGRGQFEATSALVRRHDPGDPRWRQLRFHAFDLPAHPGRFCERDAALSQLLAGQPGPHLVQVAQQRLDSHAAINALLARIVAAGGEGLMLQHCDNRYRAGRSPLLFKYKPFHDAEATVIAHLPGRGAAGGLTGALRVRDDQGRVFAVGSGMDDRLRRQPPAIGSRITYRYTERTAAGLPRFPRLLRLRDDEPPAAGNVPSSTAGRDPVQ